MLTKLARRAMAPLSAALASPLVEPLAAQPRAPAPDTTRAPMRVDVKMLPPYPSPAETVYDSVYLMQQAARSHVWYVNSYMRHPYSVRLASVRDERSCRARVVEFTAPQGAVAASALTGPSVKITPDWVRAYPDTVPVCHAEVRWRLGDVPGRQTLYARLLRNEKHVVPDSVLRIQLASGLVQWVASAHALPSLVAGFSYTVGPDPQPRERADSLLGQRGQPFFGVEFAPLALSGIRRVARASERVRVTLGTSYRSPGKDFYVGLNPLVAADGLRTTVFPVQLTTGYRRLGRRGAFFVGGTANASAFFSNFLGAILPAAK